jgi:hypothetical protein
VTVILDLPPSIEQAYLAEAHARGLPLEALVREVLMAHSATASPQSDEMSPDEWVREFRTWMSSHAGDDFPILSDEALSRESIYAERDL